MDIFEGIEPVKLTPKESFIIKSDMKSKKTELDENRVRVDLTIEVHVLDDGKAVVYRRLSAGMRTIEERILCYDGTWDVFEGEIQGIHKLELRGKGF